MDISKSNRWLVGLVAVSLTLMQPIILPKYNLFFLVPFVIINYYQTSFLKCLWISAACGLILDIFTAHMHFGINALNYSLTTFLLYSLHQHFFADRISTLPFMTFLFSICSSLIQLFFNYIFNKQISFSFLFLFSDIFLMPVFDAIYSLVIYVIPLAIIAPRQRFGYDYFSKQSIKKKVS